MISISISIRISRRMKVLIAGAVALVVMLFIVGMKSTMPAAAQPMLQAGCPTATPPTDPGRTFNYQGFLRLANGSIANDNYSITLRIYDQVISGRCLHEESFTNVVVRDGIFTVVVGDSRAIGLEVFAQAPRFLGITVAPDTDEMVPRQRIHPVPWALYGVPPGAIVMWSGSIASIPAGWALCDGANGTPDLRNRFIVGAGSGYTVGATGGEASHTLTVAEMPSHNHANGSWNRLLMSDGNGTTQGLDFSPTEPNISHSTEIQPAGGNQPHENRPPYYALAYIMKK